jgi:serine/threonine-protein kinase
MSNDDRVTIADPLVGATHPGPAPVPADHRPVPSGGGACPAPDLIGLGFADAHGLASAARLRLAVSVWETSVGPWGRVLDQQPPPGERVRRGGRIVVTVSARPQEQIPDVRGLPLDEAIERLLWLGFVPLADLRRPSRLRSASHIVSTRPMAGALLACGSVVALTVDRTEPGTAAYSGSACADVP